MKIVVFHGGGSKLFLDNICSRLRINNEIVISDSIDPKEIYILLKWADIAWIEWAAGHSIIISQLPKVCPLVLRIHSQEIFLKDTFFINWSNIDKIIFVSPLIQELFNIQVKSNTNVCSSTVIYNAVDTNVFTLKKTFHPTYKVGCVSLKLTEPKNSAFAIQCFYEMLKQNDKLTLHLTGEPTASIEGNRINIYLKHIISILGIQHKVFFEGNIQPREMNNWLEDKDYLLSTSTFESFGMNIAEAMAKGITPIIHHFKGATLFFPQEYIFNEISECGRIMSKYNKQNELREYIIKNFSLSQQTAKIENLFQQVITDFKNRKPGIQVSSYWENRYRHGGTSGSGSFGRLAKFKAKFVNSFVKEYNIKSIVELGCGDGNQLQLSDYPQYIGFDISTTAIALCKSKFQNDPTKTFFHYNNENYLQCIQEMSLQIDLALSLDVIFHLVEDNIYESYMKHLFSSSRQYIIIYSSNVNIPYNGTHERHRKFTLWIKENEPTWTVMQYVKNKYPYNPANPQHTSNSDFFVFKKKE